MIVRRCALLLALATLLDAVEPAPTPRPYETQEIAELLRRADELRLAEDSHWLVLLHYARGLFGRGSRVDDPQFFLAPTGKHDPRAELHQTLRGLLAPATTDVKQAVAGRFPARCEWLCEQLGLDRSRLPVTGDPEFTAAYAALSPRSAALVFPAAYMNTPASMFGHTLLLVRSRFQSTLLSQAINYAAVTTENNGLIFALRGIFGLYPGYYSLLPYYQKVKEYTDLDQRDLWEYELNLNETEIRRLLLHVWEMRGIASDYYFFDENCSYSLLYLLDAARPGLELHRTGGLWVIPLDTMKSARDAGLFAGCVYRPSRSARVKYLASLLNRTAATAAHDLAHATTTVELMTARHADPVERARICELSAEYLQSLRGDQAITQEDYRRRLVPILSARSTVPLTADQLGTREVPAPSRPDHAHPSGRIALGVGRNGAQEFAEFAYRPAYHDLLDPSEGFLPGAQIEFANLVLRWYEPDQRQQRLVLQRFDAIRLSSFSDLDRFYTPVSWRINTGIVREQVEDEGDARHHGYLDLGAGVSVGVGNGGLLYGLVQADARVYGHDPYHSVGAGPTAGLLLPVGRRWLINPHASVTTFLLGEQADNWEIGVNQRFQLTPWCSLTADLTRRETWEWQATTAMLRMLIYF